MIGQQLSGKILIVEDEVIILEMLSRLLLRAGFDVDGVGSADAALPFLDQSRYDVVLTDIMLPGTYSGIDLLAYVKAQFPTTSVIVYTAHQRDDLREASQHYRADAYLIKPVDNHIMREKVQQAVELAHHRKQSAAASG